MKNVPFAAVKLSKWKTPCSYPCPSMVCQLIECDEKSSDTSSLVSDVIGVRLWITIGSQKGLTEIDKYCNPVRDINPFCSTTCSFQYLFSDKKSTNNGRKTFDLVLPVIEDYANLSDWPNMVVRWHFGRTDPVRGAEWERSSSGDIKNADETSKHPRGHNLLTKSW